MGRRPPAIDAGARHRLTARFGDGVAPWFDTLPDLLTTLADLWRFEFVVPIPRGSVSVVFRCLMHDGRQAVLKASPDRPRLRTEASALDLWDDRRATPALFEFDDPLGAMLIEAIDPGAPLIEAADVPSPEGIGHLIGGLHRSGPFEPWFPSVAQRVDYLFKASTSLYERAPDLVDVVSKSLYERGHGLATHLAESGELAVLLHGDLTPSNVLDGGIERGLVAIDPAPCIGDPAFDAVDLIMWRIEDLATVDGRIARVAATANLDQQRVRAWCSAFAGMNALELSSLGTSGAQVDALTTLARLG